MTSDQLPPLPSPLAFSSELIKARTELGLTQSQVATKSGLSASAIKAYETGRNLPGARELRELCQALEISPNKLLFGTEAPFQPRTFANLLTDGEGEDEHVARGRATFLLGMLSSDERDAILTIIQSMAISRHGQEKVKERIGVADLTVGMSRLLMKIFRDKANAGKDWNTQEIEAEVEAFMSRQGHDPTP